MLHTLSIFVLPALMILAAVSDCASLRIPNWLTGFTALAFFPMAWATGMPIAELGWHVLAGIILFFAGYALFALGLFGGGDAKLMAAAGLWFGTAQSLNFLTMTAIAGGILALVIAVWAAAFLSWDMSGSERTLPLRQRLRQWAPKVPYGIALAVGAILAFPGTWWMNVA
jgi:prepilin peptidase CpaA